MMSSRVRALASWPIAWRGLVVLTCAAGAITQLATPSRLPPLSEPAAAVSVARPRPAAPPENSTPLYPAIAEQPLFSPTRTRYIPPKAPPLAAVAEHSPLSDYLLLGTIVEGDTRVALLKPPDSRNAIRAVPGQTIAGWKLRQITAEAVQFENGSQSFALHFSNPRWPHP